MTWNCKQPRWKDGAGIKETPGEECTTSTRKHRKNSMNFFPLLAIVRSSREELLKNREESDAEVAFVGCIQRVLRNKECSNVAIKVVKSNIMESGTAVIL